MKISTGFLIIVILSLGCFFPDLNNELLIWDDSGYVIDNIYIRVFSCEMISWAFTTFYCNYWAPLTWISLAADYALWGLNPVGYHLTNNILHAFNAGLFLLLVSELLTLYVDRQERAGVRPAVLNRQNIVATALLAAVFFAVHPLRVESVAWAAERKDVLSTLFGLPAVLLYLLYANAAAIPEGPQKTTGRRNAATWYWLSLAFYVLSLLSKSMLVTLPAVLLVLDRFPLDRFRRTSMRTLVLEKAPFAIFALAASVITVLSQGPARIPLDQSDLLSRVLNAFRSVMAYLRLMVWPVDISPFYLHPGNIREIGLEYGIPVLFVLAVTAGCFRVMRSRPVFVAAWSVYLLTLLPVLGLAAVGPTAMAARFTYIPSMPMAVLFSLGVTVIAARASRSRAGTIALWTGMAALLLLSASATVKQIGYWRDDVTLWTRVIDLQPHASGRAYFQRGYAYAIRGESRKALDDVNEALAIAESKRYNRMHDIFSVRAQILSDLQDLDGAIADMTRAIESAGEAERAQYLRERGLLFRMQGKTELAHRDFSRAGILGGAGHEHVSTR